MEVEINAKESSRLFSLRDFRELSQYRDLLYMLVKRDISVLYKQTVLGFAWAILKPLVQMVLFTYIFGNLAGMSDRIPAGTPYAIFVFAGLVPWTYFSTALAGSTGSLISNVQFLTKIYFPRLIIPLTPIISKLLDFGVAFAALLIFLPFYGVSFNIQMLYLPLVMVLMVVATFGMGMWLSAMAIQYRDVQQLFQYVIQLLLFVTPVILPVTALPNIPWVRTLYSLYPMAGVIEGFRSCILGYPMPWQLLGMGAISSIVILVTGMMYFRSKEDFFADVV